ncbi:hypothetical protein [Pseudanabaena sp. BC1403]|uniref:hypothetical protein n=1 Tax=Pseudanabaena sp. BC1403 TaxID=2043171 RepID=UPI000CD90FB2|nr:hypothetical protein [Pseudanabaena sp. BC1403]
MSLEPKDTPQGIVGFAFANALVEGEYNVAFNMLSAQLQIEFTPLSLKEKFEYMVGYGCSDPDFVEVMSAEDDWYIKEALDIGWAYVAISGDGFGEAVTVVVTQEQSKHVIREIDWGRP